MFALRRDLRRESTGVWQILFCLTVLSFLCRAMIPTGYMPDVSGARDGKFFLTLCTVGGGTSTVSLDWDHQSDHPSPDDHFDQQSCPFGIVASQAVLPGQASPSLVGPAAFHPVVLPHRGPAQPPMPAQGPPLGSRAPPSNLG